MFEATAASRSLRRSASAATRLPTTCVGPARSALPGQRRRSWMMVPWNAVCSPRRSRPVSRHSRNRTGGVCMPSCGVRASPCCWCHRSRVALALDRVGVGCASSLRAWWSPSAGVLPSPVSALGRSTPFTGLWARHSCYKDTRTAMPAGAAPCCRRESGQPDRHARR